MLLQVERKASLVKELTDQAALLRDWSRQQAAAESAVAVDAARERARYEQQLDEVRKHRHHQMRYLP